MIRVGLAPSKQSPFRLLYLSMTLWRALGNQTVEITKVNGQALKRRLSRAIWDWEKRACDSGVMGPVWRTQANRSGRIGTRGDPQVVHPEVQNNPSLRLT